MIERAPHHAWTLGGLAGAAMLAGLLACAGSEDLALRYPPADERSIDLYADPPAAPSSPLSSGEDALAVVLRDESLVRHLRGMDAKYSGRRREHLAWSAGAVFRTEPEPQDSESAGGARIDAITQEAVASEGGYWRVRVSSDVRETKIFYVCELRLAPSGRPLGDPSPRAACGWRKS